MANGRVTNAILNEKLDVLLQKVSNIDGRVTSLQQEMDLANRQHDEQMLLLKKKLQTWKPRKTFYLSRLWDSWPGANRKEP